MLTYKGYNAQIELDVSSGVLHGRVVEIADVITFEGDTEQQAEEEFHKSVDVYLAFCQTLDEEFHQPNSFYPLS